MNYSPSIDEDSNYEDRPGDIFDLDIDHPNGGLVIIRWGDQKIHLGFDPNNKVFKLEWDQEQTRIGKSEEGKLYIEKGQKKFTVPSWIRP